MSRLLLILVLTLALPACGFHLRDSLSLPTDLGPLQVSARDPYSALALDLQQALRRAGATVTEDDTGDVAKLSIVGERWGNTPISVDQFGRAQEFTLRYAVVFMLTAADGRVLVPEQAIELSRDYISVPTRSAGTEGEREILARELRREMTASVLRRIDAVLRAPAAAPAEPPPAQTSGLPVVAPTRS